MGLGAVAQRAMGDLVLLQAQDVDGPVKAEEGAEGVGFRRRATAADDAAAAAIIAAVIAIYPL